MRAAPRQVPVHFYLNDKLYEMMLDELRMANRSTCAATQEPGFSPALMQLLQVACLPGIVGVSARTRCVRGDGDALHAGVHRAPGRALRVRVRDRQRGGV